MIYTKDNPKLVEYFYDFEGMLTFTGVVKDKNNYIAYYLNGQLYRKDGLIVEHANGYKHWFLNGKSHREDGPAVEYPDGNKQWRLNDKCYGYNDDFTNESWIRFVQLELLK